MKDSSSPVDPRLYEALRQLEPGPLVPERSPERRSRDNAAKIEAVWQALVVRAVDSVVDSVAEPSRRSWRVRRGITTSRSWIGIAAVVLCVIGVTATLVYRSESKASTVQYRTAPGQVSRVALPGGTVMTLAPATSVAVSQTTVDVVGEASFTVASSTGQPFVVRTSNAVVQVLGTAFSVRRYANELHTQVVVEDGKVAVRAKRHGIVSEVPAAISARMMAQVSDSGVLVQSGIDPRTYTGLTTGSLVFTSVPLQKVVAELSRAYGADIRVTDSTLARRRITMTAAFARQPLLKVLDILVRITDAHVTRAGDAFVVVPGRIATPAEPLQQDRRFPQPEKSYGR